VTFNHRVFNVRLTIFAYPDNSQVPVINSSVASYSVQTFTDTLFTDTGKQSAEHLLTPNQQLELPTIVEDDGTKQCDSTTHVIGVYVSSEQL